MPIYQPALKPSDFAQGPGWLAFLAARLGTRQWALADRLTDRLRRQGYEVAISQERYAALASEYGGRVLALAILQHPRANGGAQPGV